MNIQEQIIAYIERQDQPKHLEMLVLHEQILLLLPNCKLWFLDGQDEKGKIVSNPTVGYGFPTRKQTHRKRVI